MLQEEQCWQAVLARDVHMDGAFVFAVSSTGIYCKPSCPARRARRKNVSFFLQPAAAEEAGYRPCRRCHPQVQVAEPGIVQKTCTYIEAHCAETLTLTHLGHEMGMSPYHLQRIFKQTMGITPRQYAEACRWRELKTQLREEKTVTAALYDAGYGSSSRLYERAPAQLGMTPTMYRRGGEGMAITYNIVDSPRGRLLVGATERGVCAVSLGDSDEVLAAALAQEYPAAQITRNPAGSGVGPWVAEILRYLEGQPDLNLPLDVQATAFQWRIWQELRAIPYGETRSYGEIARAVGDAKKARAVARACASNPVALIIPCHRVVRGDGDSGGYRWGVERKRQLLAQEQATASNSAAIVDGTLSHH